MCVCIYNCSAHSATFSRIPLFRLVVSSGDRGQRARLAHLPLLVQDSQGELHRAGNKGDGRSARAAIPGEQKHSQSYLTRTYISVCKCVCVCVCIEGRDRVKD